jgi:hypothetical protein
MRVDLSRGYKVVTGTFKSKLEAPNPGEQRHDLHRVTCISIDRLVQFGMRRVNRGREGSAQTG